MSRVRLQREEMAKKEAEMGAERERVAHEKAALMKEKTDAVKDKDAMVKEKTDALKERDALAAQLTAAAEAAAKEKSDLMQKAQKLTNVSGVRCCGCCGCCWGRGGSGVWGRVVLKQARRCLRYHGWMDGNLSVPLKDGRRSACVVTADVATCLEYHMALASHPL
jgi:hypothetical protein